MADGQHADDRGWKQHVDDRTATTLVIAEECPDWRNPTERMCTPVAKLHFVRASGLWTLYRMRADLKWHAYQSASPSQDLATLVDVVDRDEYCALFG